MQPNPASGWGLDAKESVIAGYLAATGAQRLNTYEKRESGKIRTSERPELAKAIAEAREPSRLSHQTTQQN